MAFKAEIDDVRASLSYKIKKVLTAQARGNGTTDLTKTDPELRTLDEVIGMS